VIDSSSNPGLFAELFATKLKYEGKGCGKNGKNDLERNTFRVNLEARKQAKSLNAEGFKHHSVCAEIFFRNSQK
jgi:hypothetical protein